MYNWRRWPFIKVHSAYWTPFTFWESSLIFQCMSCMQMKDIYFWHTPTVLFLVEPLMVKVKRREACAMATEDDFFYGF